MRSTGVEMPSLLLLELAIWVACNTCSTADCSRDCFHRPPPSRRRACDQNGLIRLGRGKSWHRSQAMLKMLEDGLMHPQFSPPGQHAFLGDVERMWYVLFVRMLIAVRQAECPKIMWFDGMSNALDVECTLVSRCSGTYHKI